MPLAPVSTSSRGRTVVPLTHMEMLQRTWLRWLKILVVLLIITAGAGLGLSVAANILLQPTNAPDVSSPAPPQLPAQLYIPDPPQDSDPPL